MVAGSNPVTPTTIFPEASAEKQGLFLLWRAVRAAHGQRSALQDVDCDPQIRCIFFSGFHFDEAYFDIRPNSPNFKRKFQILGPLSFDKIITFHSPGPPLSEARPGTQ